MAIAIVFKTHQFILLVGTITTEKVALVKKIPKSWTKDIKEKTANNITIMIKDFLSNGDIFLIVITS